MAYGFWYGDDESHENLIHAQVQVQKMLARISASDDGYPDLPPIWSKEGDLAVIDIRGSLVQGNAGWMRLFGVTGYMDILDAIIKAVADTDVKKILMRIESGGGSTNGLQELADYIVKLGKTKPIFAHTENVAASAGYWLLCSAGVVSMNPVAQAGSIGCISVITSTIRAYEEAGYDKKVVRSGKYKGLGRADEAISELAEQELQSKVNALSDMFDAYVGKRRGRTAAQVNAEMGQGRMFLGKEALAVGLVDKVATYEQTLRAIEKS